MVVQFTIQGANSTHKFIIKDGKYYDNNVEITAERYQEALKYLNANRAKK